ncbi:MAG: tyrosine decarboxylase MfnA [Candidatus Thorarchaeota archaeon]
MLKEGLEKEEILEILEEKLRKDISYDTGSILGAMCTKPLELGIEVYMKFISKNLGDPGLFLGTAALEKELITEIGELFGGKDLIGAFTSGGSEANLIALRTAKRLRSDIKNPEIVLSKSAHISFDKAADLLGITLRKANLKENYELDLDHFKSLINKNTCGVVGIAGTTPLGLVDAIEEIGKLVEEKGIFFHVDAAFGGFVLPFLKILGFQIRNWDFSVKSVDSITADPHKMGMGIIPTGGIFLRDNTILKKTGYEIPYLAGGNFKHLHLVGTRSGGTVIAFWAITRALGVNGFVKIVKKCMDNTEYLTKKLKKIEGIRIICKPEMNIVGITTESGENVRKLDKKLRERQWMVGKFEDLNLLRIVVMPHVQKMHLKRFCNDLESIVKLI